MLATYGATTSGKTQRAGSKPRAFMSATQAALSVSEQKINVEEVKKKKMEKRRKIKKKEKREKKKKKKMMIIKKKKKMKWRKKRQK